MVRVLSALVASWTVCLACFAADWPSWRGPTRNGLTSESSGWRGGKWVSKEPVWKAAVGEGSTSPVVVKDRLYTLGNADGSDTLWCLDVATGKEVRKVSSRCPRYGRFHVGDESLYGGPARHRNTTRQ